MTEYRILPPVIERSGLIHKLIERNGMIGIYKTYHPKEPKSVYGYCVARISREKRSSLQKWACNSCSREVSFTF